MSKMHSKLKLKYSARMSDAQKMAIGEYLKKCPELIDARFTNNFQKSEARVFWVKLAKQLNGIPGSKKNWQQWRRSWHDLRKAILKKTDLAKRKIKAVYMSPSELFIQKIYLENRKAIKSGISPLKEEKIESLGIDEVNVKSDPDNPEDPDEELDSDDEDDDEDDAEEENGDPFASLEGLEGVSEIPCNGGEDFEDDAAVEFSAGVSHEVPQDDFDVDLEEEIEKIASKRPKCNTKNIQEAQMFWNKSTFVNERSDELLKRMQEQAKAEREYQQAHLKLMEKQTKAMEAMVEESHEGIPGTTSDSWRFKLNLQKLSRRSFYG
uniref:Regulatory protein zeste n=1 Tax=Lutzomyia longipalpis TaxID=7200 RepID=A0A1B0C819_LUTLO